MMIPGASRPRRGGFYARVSKSMADEMIAEGATIAEIGLFSIMLSDLQTSILGSVYRKNEWSEIAGSNPDFVDKCLTNLESMGFIATDGWNLLIRSYARINAFSSPKVLKSGLYTLQNGLKSPLLRFVVGAEMLRIKLDDRPSDNARNLHEAATTLWAEITGEQLPPTHHMRGIEQPNPEMLDALVRMPGADAVLAELDKREWAVVTPLLRDPIRAAFEARQDRTVRPLRRTGTDRQRRGG